MNCQDVEIHIHGFLDRELELGATLEVESHLETCTSCRMKFQELSAMRTAMQDAMSYHRAPDSLRALLQKPPYSVREQNRKQHKSLFAPWRMLASVSAVAVLFLAVGIGLQLQEEAPLDRLSEEVVASHVRSLLAAHLTDVASSDRHTVKPWFEGKLDFSPPVVDLSGQGFPLIGGRLDYLNARAVTALIYRRRQHVINVFIWPKDADEPQVEYNVTRKGYNVISFKSGEMNYWVVSDLNKKELAELGNLLHAP
ncbi:anti-sigma factor [Candidatus Methylospira mobilis]|uniref:Anti-sigma factor n=1 Tax=Candidatus Methylospira mobilis TaxID=1808979 RepID=A0A5Q0BHV8_9GAMM|nr:anti-sigma factor [Candidatus Methylospira mobilis]QFY41757.1 anti-sigma factor [Candidatus Methylospira mobilis]WNV06615.1 anti-sigma factor [Candidatus Methylospira mobilis]